MNKYNTLLAQLLSLVNRSEFNKLVNKTESDKYCKGFTTWEQSAGVVIVSHKDIGIKESLNRIEIGKNT